MTSEPCEHLTFELNTEVAEADDPQLGKWRLAVLRIRCTTCRLQFAWRGLASGLPNPLEPTTSADGYELRAPISPRPGGVVGLLQSAGLEHLLGEEGPRGNN